MSFLTSHMEAMLAIATDPEEIELRRKVLDDHLKMQEEMAARKAEEAAFIAAQD
jgi:hypothetical protein